MVRITSAGSLYSGRGVTVFYCTQKFRAQYLSCINWNYFIALRRINAITQQLDIWPLVTFPVIYA